MTGLKELSENPHKPFVIEDDAEAQMFLLTIGLGGRLSKTPVDVTSAAQVVADGNHPTHFIIAIRFSGKTKASDNGYVVHCLPKSKFPPEKAKEFLSKILEGQGQVAVAKSFPSSFQSN